MRFRPVITWKASAAVALATALFAGPLYAMPGAESDQKYSNARIVRLSYVTGQVQISRPEEDDWENALVNMPVQEGYAIATGQGRVEIEFESGATVRLDDYSEVQFNEMRLVDGNRITRMTLSQGSAIFYANLARNDEFTVVTTGVHVTVPRNSRFRMDVTQKHVNVAVWKGDVTVETQAGNYKLAKGQALLFDARSSENAVVARAGEWDEFDRWAADRDDAISTARTNSLNYVSAPFRYGVGDLSRHGTWVYAAPYGYVWQPWGISVGWSPYYHGRWVYVRGYGWTWVSYEPWGWLPYHYGSWTYLHSGWAWVPGALHHSWWHPGLVVWLNFGGGRYGWCARNPFDRPGRIHHNVHINNTVIVNTGTGIIGGGRHERLQRLSDVRYVDNGGPRERNYFGDVNQIRRGFGGRATTAGERTGSGETNRPGFAGRTEELRRPDLVERGGATGTGTTATDTGTVERGFSGRADTTGRRFSDEAGRSAERTEELRGRPERMTGEQLEPRGFSGRSTDQLRPRTLDNDTTERRRPRFGDPGNSLEYDPQSRRFENRPVTRTDERSGEDRGDSSRGFGGRRDPDLQPRSYPRNDGARERNGGGFGGQRPSYEPPRRAPEPRYERNDSGSRTGGWGGRSEPSRPSHSPPPRSEPPRSSPPSSGGGGFGGGRPSSPPPSPPPAPRGGSERRPN
jgi:uncharacterized protein YaiE (UPF0345 family)